MEGKQVVYQGRNIATDGFRAFIYGIDGSKKLMNSWDDYEFHIAQGIWFSNLDDVKAFNQLDEEKTGSHKKRSK